MSIRAALRSATWTCHQRLEKRLNIAQRFAEPGTYRRHLEKMWGFCAPLEAEMAEHLSAEALADFSRRRKIPLIARDLSALGLSVEAIDALPRCRGLPALPSTAAAFGSLYVMEGATLGGRTLAPMVEKKLGFTASHGAAFLASYGEETTDMWQRFIASIEAWCTHGERKAEAATAAGATFESLERWLCGMPA